MSLLNHNHIVPGSWLGDLPVTNRYTSGLAGERFFRAFKDEGRIYGTHCSKCNRTYVPATQFCERCLDELTRWVDVGTIGEVHTFTCLYKNYDGSPREQPELVALIRFGDCGIVHRLGEINLEEIYIGMPVEAVFKPQKDRQGSILDILYFRPTS